MLRGIKLYQAYSIKNIKGEKKEKQEENFVVQERIKFTSDNIHSGNVSMALNRDQIRLQDLIK